MHGLFVIDQIAHVVRIASTGLLGTVVTVIILREKGDLSVRPADALCPVDPKVHKSVAAGAPRM